MTTCSTGFQIVGALKHDDCVTATLAAIRRRLFYRHGALRTHHSERYVRQILAGERAMSLPFFVNALRAVEKIGNGQGREWVRQILQTLAEPFGLSVVPLSEGPTKDIHTEVAEANRAVHKLFVTVADAIEDNVITPEERAAIQRDIAKAKAEIEDVERAVRG
jgi:vacuolar-type H+-ATPase subunit F/Vma7